MSLLRWGLALLCGGLCLGSIFGGGEVAHALEPDPSAQTVIYYNARMALREGRADEAVRLWLLRNAVAQHSGWISRHDEDFRSLSWVALGDLGICQDGASLDEEGVGLWPLAMHNWVTQNLRRRPPRVTRPFKAFGIGRQQRLFSVNDVLNASELRAASFTRGACVRPQLLLLRSGEGVASTLNDRPVAARMLRYLLDESLQTMDEERVRGTAVIHARRFDLALQLTSMAAQRARQQGRDRARRGREGGMTGGEVASMRAEIPSHAMDPESEPAQILMASLDWPTSEWMALSSDRRRFLFDEARAYHDDPERLDGIALGILDALIARGEGAEVTAWIGRLHDLEAPGRAVIWEGARGQALMGLDRDQGFEERGVIALHRGVRQVEGGDLPSALRSFAFALEQAPDSSEPDRVQALSRRWLSYVVSRFESTPDLLVTLQRLVPPRDYGIILEDLMWRAAFHADGASFQHGLDHQLGRGALHRRLGLLEPLASGDLTGFIRGIDEGLRRSPSETLRFLGQLVERLELEDEEIRLAQRATLLRLREAVRPLSESDGGPGRGRQLRAAQGLLERISALLEGQAALDPQATARDRARSLSPTAEVYAGSVRLVPADPLPWPFRAVSTAAPSAFTPIRLLPEEWRDPSGAVVFGWRIEG